MRHSHLSCFTPLVLTHVRRERSGVRGGRGEVPGLNIFEVSDILNATNTSFDEVAQDGAVFSIGFNWDCNLDVDIDECLPDIKFSRLDDPEAEDKGFSFPYTTYSTDKEQGIQFRYLRQAYGLRFLIESTGRGRRFDWATIVVKLGSTAALIGLATVFVDFCSLYILPKKEVYQKVKYRHLNEAEEVERLNQEKNEQSLLGGKKASSKRPAAAEGPSSYGTVSSKQQSLSDEKDGSAASCVFSGDAVASDPDSALHWAAADPQSRVSLGIG